MSKFMISVAIFMAVWLLAMCALKATPAGAQSDPVPTMWAIGTPTLSPYPPLPTATSTPDAPQQTTVYLPLIQHYVEDVRPDDMAIWLVSWLPSIGGAG